MNEQLTNAELLELCRARQRCARRQRQAPPSIPKLIAKLALRIVLVIGAAIVALAVIS